MGRERSCLEEAWQYRKITWAEMGRIVWGLRTFRGTMGVKCKHQQVYRVRGSQIERVLLSERAQREDGVVWMKALIVWEICMQCNKQKKILFKHGAG